FLCLRVVVHHCAFLFKHLLPALQPAGIGLGQLLAGAVTCLGAKHRQRVSPAVLLLHKPWDQVVVANDSTLQTLATPEVSPHGGHCLDVVLALVLLDHPLVGLALLEPANDLSLVDDLPLGHTLPVPVSLILVDWLHFHTTPCGST